MDESDPVRTRRIDTRLAELNDWESRYGNTYGVNATLGSSGEAPARIDSLKGELRDLGAVFQWKGNAYVLVRVVAEGAGEQLADRR